MKTEQVKLDQLRELLVASLEHERGGKLVYEAALECVENDTLRKEFQSYLAETNKHIDILENVFERLDLDVDMQTPLRKAVHDVGAALVDAINHVKSTADSSTAELFACECVVLAETKDHFDWELLHECAGKLSDTEGRVLKDALEQVEDQEDRHLYHSKGWCRELWMKSLGLRAVLPPPEERKNVKTAIGAALAEQARAIMR